MDKTSWYRHYIPLLLFALVSGTSFLAIVLSRGSLLNTYFLPTPTDSAMDYFNCLATASSDQPYANGSNYPPLCFIIFKVLHYVVPAGVPDAGQLAQSGAASAGFFLRNYEPAFISYIVFTVLCIVGICFSIIHMTRSLPEPLRYCIVLVNILSGPFLFLLERGNLLLLSVCGVFVFAALYQSPNRALRIIAYISLSISAAIKIYPSIFSFILLSKRRFRAFSFTVLLTLMLFIVPFALLGGMDAISGLLAGLNQFIDEHSVHGLGLQFSILNTLHLVEAIVGSALPRNLEIVLCFVVLVLGVYLLVRKTPSWTKFVVAGLLCVAVPSVSYTYSLVMLLPGLTMGVIDRLGSPHTSRLRSIQLCLLSLSACTITLPIVPLPGNAPESVVYPLYWGGLVINLALILLFASIVLDTIHDLGRCSLPSADAIKGNRCRTLDL